MSETEGVPTNQIYFRDEKTGYWTIGVRQEDGSYCGVLGGMTRDTVPWSGYYNGIRIVVCNTINQYLKECEEQGIEPETPQEWEGFQNDTNN